MEECGGGCRVTVAVAAEIAVPPTLAWASCAGMGQQRLFFAEKQPADGRLPSDYHILKAMGALLPSDQQRLNFAEKQPEGREAVRPRRPRVPCRFAWPLCKDGTRILLHLLQEGSEIADEGETKKLELKFALEPLTKLVVEKLALRWPAEGGACRAAGALRGPCLAAGDCGARSALPLLRRPADAGLIL